ncbi:MAG: hypothetical protein JWQ36_695 [Enterovirga sp.]|jgi:hypothetical protein|nr:hypothetical protein [Enterovirga sp.]
MKSVHLVPPLAVAAISLALSGSALGLPGDTALLPEVMGIAQLYAVDPHSGLALNGLDPVSYQLEGRAAAGDAAHEALWSGLGWRFVSAANRAAFLRSPERFAPRLGGYDADAAAEGRLVEADPVIFVVRAGRLYLFRTRAARARFLAEPASAGRAEARWPQLARRLVRG